VSAGPVQVVNQGPQSGPLTALYAGDLIQTPRGLAPLSLEGFSEDLDEDGYVDPIADAEPVVAAAPAVQYAAAPVQYAAAPAVQYATAPVQYAAAPVQYAAAPAVQYAAAPAVQYAAAPVQYAAAPAVQYAATPAVQYAAAPSVQYAAAPSVQYAAAPAAAVKYAYNYPSVYGTSAAVPQTWATGKLLKLILSKVISKSNFFLSKGSVAYSGAAVGGCVNYQGSVVPCAAE
jgi:hypothetical protein